jgi:hypothetical protein
MLSKTTEICIYKKFEGSSIAREVIVSLVKNQRSERNSDDVQKLVLEQDKGYHDHNRGTWPVRIWAR